MHYGKSEKNRCITYCLKTVRKRVKMKVNHSLDFLQIVGLILLPTRTYTEG